jgi:hypothetical protein
MTIQLTKHALDRAKERLGVKESGLTKLAKRAMKRGISHKKSKGRVRKFFDGLHTNPLYSNSVNNVRIYGEYVYLFNGSKLVTLFEVPT